MIALYHYPDCTTGVAFRGAAMPSGFSCRSNLSISPVAKPANDGRADNRGALDHALGHLSSRGWLINNKQPMSMFE